MLTQFSKYIWVEEGGRGGDQRQGVESESDWEGWDQVGTSGASWNPTFVQSTSTSGTNHVHRGFSSFRFEGWIRKCLGGPWQRWVGGSSQTAQVIHKIITACFICNNHQHPANKCNQMIWNFFLGQFREPKTLLMSPWPVRMANRWKHTRWSWQPPVQKQAPPPTDLYEREDIWKHTVVNIQTYATNVTMQVMRGNKSKFTAEKSQSNATNIKL